LTCAGEKLGKNTLPIGSGNNREEEMSKKQWKIYCDMDGVVANFDALFLQMFGTSPELFKMTLGEAKFWEHIYSFRGFFAKIPAYKGAGDFFAELLRITPHVMLLTAPSRTNFELCKSQKLEWIRNEMPKVNGYPPMVIFEKNKYIYACPNSILIDDYGKKIGKWIEAGGIGIKHKNFEQTLQKLSSITRERK